MFEPVRPDFSTPADECCCECGVAQTNSIRPYYPLWFRRLDGQAVCPACVPLQPATATMSRVVEAVAIVALSLADDSHSEWSPPLANRLPESPRAL